MTRKRAAGEGTLRQRVDKSWEWRTPSGFPVKKSFTAKRQEDVLAKRRVLWTGRKKALG